MMKKFLYPYTVKFKSSLLPVAFLLSIVTLSACSDEANDLPAVNGNDGDALSFSVKLDSDFSTRAVDDEINWNTAQILFFDESGDFLFDASGNIKKADETIETKGYKILTFTLADIDGVKASDIKNQLMNNDFMVAVLANWSEYANWGSSESKLKDGNSNVKNINDLHTEVDAVAWLDENLQPSASKPIPVFGVQKFTALSEWLPNTTKVIEPSDKYISLIRSLAKVELSLPQGVKQVYIRNVNGSGRNEVVDLKTSTSDSWKAHEKGKCEWFAIKDKGPAPKTSSEYQDWLNWFKGNTHIFNPEIDTPVECMFSENNSTGNYVIYVPDTNISFWDTTSEKASVPYIEYTYDGDEIRDKEWKRLYFTDYSVTNHPLKSVKANEYDKYESDPNNLKLHWPIMRNHKYIFSVVQGNYDLIVTVRISKWDYVKETHNWDWDFSSSLSD